jgi:ATP adenylyltransferase
MTLERAGLWSSIVEQSRAALESGALVPVETDGVVVEDGRIPFLVRVARNLERKATPVGSRPVHPVDPFDPPEPALTLGPLGHSHLAVLNKFNVVEHHLLVVTKHFVEQDERLDVADFSALWACLAQVDGLGFYNGGRAAGASQRHKHLQLVPTPVGGAGPRTAIDALVREGHLPFPAALAPFDPEPGSAQATYLALLDRAGCARGAPYNLLITRDFMLLVPRSREHARGISMNALAFAGSLFVKDPAALELVRGVGPVRLLNEVCGAPGAPGSQ